MIKVYDALKVDGKDGFLIHCYGAFYGQCVDRAYLELKSFEIPGLVQFYKLFDERESLGCLLCEVTTSDLKRIPETVLNVMNSMYSSTSECLASICMYDGAFCEFGDLFSDDIFSQVYAFSMREYEPVITFDQEVLVSDFWRRIIAESRKRFLMKLNEK